MAQLERDSEQWAAETIETAHGRVNLIGEHTDYNGGWVLPTAIPQATIVRLRLRSDQRARVSTSLPMDTTESYELGQEVPRGDWLDYVQGATALLAQLGIKLRGFEARIESSVPIGSGLSSSAALEVSFLKALRRALELPLSDVEIAKIGQRIENEFVGARVGIMDQMACSLARLGEALFLDTRSLEYERLALPLDRMEMIVINSGVAHQNVSGQYNLRRSECEEACDQLGIGLLRDIGTVDLPGIEALPQPFRQRARHVVTENARVHSAVRAIKASDVNALGRLFNESHLSMRNDFEVSIPEIDLLVELCQKDPATFGARLTGGGFGGSIVAITAPGAARAVAVRVVSEYNRRTPYGATIAVP